MKVDEIRLLYDANDWAGARTLEACAKGNAEHDSII
jgi:hypothetical protein